MRVGQVQEDEARKSAQLAAEKDQERKRKYQEVEEDCWQNSVEQELVEEEKRRIKAAKKAS